MKNKIYELSGPLTERINATKMDDDKDNKSRQIPFLLIKLLEKLVAEKSKMIVKEIFGSFVESTFFKSLAHFYGKMLTDINWSIADRKKACMSGITVMMALLDLYPSRFE